MFFFRKASLYMLPALLWILLVALLCFTPSEHLPPGGYLQYDKLGHLGIFLILTFLLLWGLQKSMHSLSLMSLFSSGFAILYAGLIELVQAWYIPGRSGDWIDFVADVLGNVLGLLLFILLRKSPLQKFLLMDV